MPPASGRNPSAALRGLTHTMRCASRDSRPICTAMSAGSSCDQPSERMTTTAAIRVPLDHSPDSAAAAARARSASPPASWRVMRVSPVAIIVESAVDIPRLLGERVYDIALGAQPAPARSRGLSVVPFLKYQRVVVASVHHPLAQRADLVLKSELLSVPWFRGPGTFEPETEEGRWLGGLSTLPDAIELTSENDALAAVASGEGVMLALSHLIAPRLLPANGPIGEPGKDLVRLHVAGTPVTGLWSATTLDRDGASESARALQRAARTAEATSAMIAPSGSRGLSMRGNKLRAALWSRGLGPPPE